MFFLLPVIALFPLAAGIQGFLTLNRRLSKIGVDPVDLQAVWSSQITSVILAYVTIFVILATLLSILQIPANRPF